MIPLIMKSGLYNSEGAGLVLSGTTDTDTRGS